MISLTGDDHRKHDCKCAIHGGAQDGPELRPEDIPPVEADPNRPVAHRGIFFFLEIEVIHLFVGSDVQGPDNHFFPAMVSATV